MDFATVLILGVVQGITEFLPISSDGHLAVTVALIEAARDVELPESLSVNIVLHAGTLLAVLAVFWRRIVALAGEDRRVLGLLAAGTVPVVAIWLPVRLLGGDWLTDPLLAGLMLPLNGLMLLASARIPMGQTPYQQLSHARALAIGCAQALAPLPGISRSGTTICAGLALGLERSAAATFSFLLALPVIAGACLLELVKLLAADQPATPWPVLAAGTLVSFLVGLAALSWLLRWLETGRLHLFAWWCIALGIAVTLWQVSLTNWFGS